MRVPAGRAVRVEPGDEVVVQACLPKSAKSGRLYVFASEGGEYSPYVEAVDVTFGKPTMLVPLSLRLTIQNPVRELTFVSHIDGCIRIMQEVDTADELRAEVRLRRKFDPNLSWREWAARKFIRIWTW